jgi:hypothetical protein
MAGPSVSCVCSWYVLNDRWLKGKLRRRSESRRPAGPKQPPGQRVLPSGCGGDHWRRRRCHEPLNFSNETAGCDQQRARSTPAAPPPRSRGPAGGSGTLRPPVTPPRSLRFLSAVAHRPAVSVAAVVQSPVQARVHRRASAVALQRFPQRDGAVVCGDSPPPPAACPGTDLQAVDVGGGVVSS